MSSPIWPATASGCGKDLGSKMIDPSNRTQVSCGAPRLVTIGGKSTTVDVSAAALAGASACLPAEGGAGRNASKAAPVQTARPITVANSINDPRGDLFATAPWVEAESDISAP